MKKVYFATPVNGRTEPTLAEKKEAALGRSKELEKLVDIELTNKVEPSLF